MKDDRGGHLKLLKGRHLSLGVFDQAAAAVESSPGVNPPQAGNVIPSHTRTHACFGNPPPAQVCSQREAAKPKFTPQGSERVNVFEGGRIKEGVKENE